MNVLERGFWQHKPNGWPDDVPFVDPNNPSQNDQGKMEKPSGKTLQKMMAFLVEKYEVSPERERERERERGREGRRERDRERGREGILGVLPWGESFVKRNLVSVRR